MIATLFSLLIAAYLYLNPLDSKGSDFLIMGIIILIISTLFVLAQIWVNIFAWRPLQKAEYKLTPRVSELFRQDFHLRFTNLFLLFFTLISYLAVLDLMYVRLIQPSLLMIIWTVLLGISVDVAAHLFHRVMAYLNPFQVVTMITKRAEKAIRNAEELDLSHWIDTLSEISMKAIDRKSNSLAIHAISQFNEITERYLRSEKVITHHKEEEQEELHVSDPISYMLFFLLQRLEMINNLALEKNLDSVCSHIEKTLGRITISAAKFDITLANYPVHYMGKFAKQAQEKGMEEIGNNTLITLLEVGKIILQEVDIQYLEIKEFFSSIIFYMHEIAKESFRLNKDTNLKLLTQPFRDLKKLFQGEKVAAHQDVKMIEKMIDSVLEEFAALEGVMSTMPPKKGKAEK